MPTNKPVFFPDAAPREAPSDTTEREHRAALIDRYGYREIGMYLVLDGRHVWRAVLVPPERLGGLAHVQPPGRQSTIELRLDMQNKRDVMMFYNLRRAEHAVEPVHIDVQSLLPTAPNGWTDGLYRVVSTRLDGHTSFGFAAVEPWSTA